MNIVFYGGHYWNNGAWFRKQQFASRLAKRGHKVIYIESSTSLIDKSSKKNNNFTYSITKINNNLYIFTPPKLLPYISNYYSRYLSNLRNFVLIKRMLHSLGVYNYILWNNNMSFSIMIKFLKAQHVIFDLCDDIPLYRLLNNDIKGYELQKKYLHKAFALSDITIVSAHLLKEKYQHLTNNPIILASNGHNMNNTYNKINFQRIINNGKPNIGFIGTLFKFIDDDLLEYIIKKRPNYNFIFVGKIESNFPINKIEKFKNIFLLGTKPKEHIMPLIKGFDICINPFKQHEVNDSVNPVKVFEYLAMRKYVISTPMKSLMKEKISEHIFFENDKKDFLNRIDRLVSNENYLNPINDSIIQDYHWDNIFYKLINKIKIQYDLEL